VPGAVPTITQISREFKEQLERKRLDTKGKMSIVQRSIRSAGYTVAASGFQAAVQFGRSILLARLLLPEQFGIYTYAASFVLLTYALPGFGMNAAVLHHAQQSEGETARRVHFTLNVIFNLVWVIGLICTCTWFIDVQYRWVFWTILGTQVLDNLTGTARTKLVKAIIFRRIALIESLNVFIGSGVALLLAWSGAGLMSLVSTDIISALINVLGFYVIRPVWRPRFGWEHDVAGYLLNFGKRSFSATFLLNLLDRIDDLWVGTFLGKIPLGYYSRAYTFATYPRKLLANPVNQVASGTYAELKESPKRMGEAFFRINAILVRSGFLFAGLLFLLVPEFIHFVIGDKWLPMMTPFRLMLIYTLFDPIKNTIGNVFIALGKPEKVVYTRFWQLLVMLIGLFILGPRLGISGVALAVDFMLIFGIVLLLWQVRSFIKFSVIKIFATPLLALGMGFGLTLVLQLWIQPVSLSMMSILLKAMGFLFGYGLTLLLLDREQIIYWIRAGKQML